MLKLSPRFHSCGELLYAANTQSETDLRSQPRRRRATVLKERSSRLGVGIVFLWGLQDVGIWFLSLRLKTSTFPFKRVFVFSLIRAGWIFRSWASFRKLSWIFVIGVSPTFAFFFVWLGFPSFLKDIIKLSMADVILDVGRHRRILRRISLRDKGDV